ncbi:MAG: cellulase family glycosylhydrolase [Spirochaetes bacterium]|nr:cellulase family glycosylhydrolase [Spirochaetota bacterium]
MIRTLVMLCSLVPLSLYAADAGPAAAPGRKIFSMDFEKEADRDRWSKAPFASWVSEGKDGGMTLKVSVPASETPGHHKIMMPIDLTPYAGMKLLFKCRVKAENVTKPKQSYLGVKWMLFYKATAGDVYMNENDVNGTFDWKDVSFTATIDDTIQSAELVLGLEMCTGDVWFDDLYISVIKDRPAALPTPKANAGPAYRGHDLPRLRGVMSPGRFNEEDFKTLGNEWNANLIRWQMGANWGKTGTDRDLDAYGAWLDGKLADVDKVLAAGSKYGVKVALDLHSPPGGRYPDKSMAMFYEKKYNDYFVALWEKIARRYKGHPALWAYDLINEPVNYKPSEEGMDYYATQVRAAKAIRAIDPVTAIIFVSENWDSPAAFKQMVPPDIPNIIYQAHFYDPGQFTHQGVGGRATGVAYPGNIGGKNYDKEVLRGILKPLRDFQLAYNAHIYIGEFSAVRFAPGAAKYLADCIDIFEGYGWDWSYHAFREWQGWSVEHANEPVDMNVHVPAATTDRKEVLLSWFAKNVKPGASAALPVSPALEKAVTAVVGSNTLPEGIIFTELFDGEKIKSFPQKIYTLAAGIAGNAMTISLDDASQSRYTAAVLPVGQMKGKRMECIASIKGENVSEPPKPYNGIKLMLSIAKSDGRKDNPQKNLPFGTFDWTNVSFTWQVPENATNAELILGMEKISGTVWFDTISVREVP